jgi:hypothetical protein
MKAMVSKVLRFALLVPLLGVACKKKEEQKSSRRLREEALEANTRDHVAVKKFADAVREVFRWRQSQPMIHAEADRHALAKKLGARLENMPTENLPEDLVKAWRAMRESWRTVANTPTLSDAQRQQGAQAAAELNQQLAARGVLDLHF